MKAKFVASPSIVAKMQREMLEHYPRAIRKTLRITTPRVKPTPQTAYGSDSRFTEEVHIDRELLLNTCDPSFDFDEFRDSDNEYEGLSVVSMGKDTRRWLKGYNIL
jgi:hypothetical protein